MSPSVRTPEVLAVQAIVDQEAPRGRQRRVLEAGCGSLSHLALHGDHVTGIDISAEQLARNPALAEKIHGDLERYPLPAAAYDLVISWDVLEHLPAPERALENLARSLAPGGLMILAVPNRDSIKGLVTRLTPHAFHVWAYRRLWGVERAGEGDRAPFRTFLRPAASAHGIRDFARRHELVIRCAMAYESLMQRKLRRDQPLVDLAYRAVGLCTRLVTGGRLDPIPSDLLFVLQRPHPDAGQRS
jgi:SAM-dependent methyltransferase